MISIFVKSFGIQRLIRFYLDRAAASNMLAWPSMASTKSLSTTIAENESQRRHSLVCDASQPVDVGVRRIKMFLFLLFIASSSSQHSESMIDKHFV